MFYANPINLAVQKPGSAFFATPLSDHAPFNKQPILKKLATGKNFSLYYYFFFPEKLLFFLQLLIVRLCIKESTYIDKHRSGLGLVYGICIIHQFKLVVLQLTTGSLKGHAFKLR